MKVLFAIGSAVTSEKLANLYYQTYGEKIEYKDVFYFKAILEEVKRDQTYDRIVIAEELEPMQTNVVDAINQMLLSNLDSITDEINDCPIIFICSQNRTKSDIFISRLYNMGIYNFLIGDDRQEGPLCKLIKDPRNKKEAKLYINANPAELSLDNEKDEGVDERELISICNYFDRLKTPDEYLKAFANVVEQYSDEDLSTIVAALTKNLKRGQEIFDTFNSHPTYAKYCAWQDRIKLDDQNVESSKKTSFFKNFGKKILKTGENEGLRDAIANRRKKEETISHKNAEDVNPISDYKSDSYNPLAAAVGGAIGAIDNKKQQEELIKKQQEELMRKQQEELIKKQQEEMMRKQQEEQLKAQQEELIRKQQEELLRKQQEEQLKAQQEAQAKAQQEALIKKQQEELIKKQQEEQLKAQKEAQAKAQQEELLRKQQEAILAAQQEAKVKAEQEALLKKQQEEQLKAQQEAKAKAEQEALLKKQQEEMLRKQQEELLRQQEERINAEKAAKQRQQEEAERLRLEAENLRKQQEAQQEAIKREALLKEQQEALRRQQEEINRQRELANLQFNNVSAGVAAGVASGVGTATYGAYNANQSNYENSNSIMHQTAASIDNDIVTNRIIPQSVPSDYKKVVAFVGPRKVGTSFIANCVATLMSMQGVKTSILDMTRSRGLYWCYFNDVDSERDIVATCMSNLSAGNATPVQVGKTKNLTLYTTIPKGREDNRKGYRHRTVLDTVRRNCNLLILDCDFTTPSEYFEQAQEIYFVQDLDLSKVSESQEFLKGLQDMRTDWNKLRLIINSTVKSTVTAKNIRKEALTYYQDPGSTYSYDIEEMTLCAEIPLEIQNYTNYINAMDSCKIAYEKFTPAFQNAIEELSKLVYGITSNTGSKRRGLFGK